MGVLKGQISLSKEFIQHLVMDIENVENFEELFMANFKKMEHHGISIKQYAKKERRRILKFDYYLPNSKKALWKYIKFLDGVVKEV